MQELIPRTLRRWEHYQFSLYKSAILAKLGTMTRGQLRMDVLGDPLPYSFGYGKKVQAAMQIHNERFFQRFFRQGELGFGESFVDGDWDSQDLVSVLRWFLLHLDELDSAPRPGVIPFGFLPLLQTVQTVYENLGKMRGPSFDKAIAGQYELERPFFQLLLDSSLTQSGALFYGQENLEEAQLQKHRRIAQELRIGEGMHILEIGAGWGSLALYLALCYPCRVTAVTISEEQFQFLEQKVKDLHLEGRVFPVYSDYRHLEGRYDRIVSVEMIDVLSRSELPEFFAFCDKRLKPQGLMVHQLQLCPERFQVDAPVGTEWVHTYMSPGTITPSLTQVLQAMNTDSSFSIRSLFDLGLSYAKTIELWRLRFEENLAELTRLGFDDIFIRRWRYYLAYSEAAFSHGLLTAVQLTMGRPTQRASEYCDSVCYDMAAKKPSHSH